MRKLAIFSFIACVALAAGDEWAKVRDLHGGTELRIYETGGKPPTLAKMADATDDSLIVVVKNEEKAIPKDKIERIDYRPQKSASRVTAENRNTVDDPGTKAPIGPDRGARVPSTQSTSNLSFGGRPDFETIYRRTPGAPHKEATPEK